MKEKKSGLISKVFGFETIKRGAVLTSSMIKDINPNKKHLIKETFEQAVKRNGISKSEENTKSLKTYRDYKIQFILVIIMSLYMFYNVLSKLFYYGLNNLSDILSMISTTTLCIALLSISLHFGLRTFQTRNKRLGMLKLWLKSPKEWYPIKISLADLEAIDNFKLENKDHLLFTDEEYINKKEEYLNKKIGKINE